MCTLVHDEINVRIKSNEAKRILWYIKISSKIISYSLFY
jgi:hypothetical protein